jgi:hypothetical protein
LRTLILIIVRGCRVDNVSTFFGYQAYSKSLCMFAVKG